MMLNESEPTGYFPFNIISACKNQNELPIKKIHNDFYNITIICLNFTVGFTKIIPIYCLTNLRVSILPEFCFNFKIYKPAGNEEISTLSCGELTVKSSSPFTP